MPRMRESSPDGPRSAAGWVVTAAIALTLGGCVETPAVGAWIPIVLAIALAVAARINTALTAASASAGTCRSMLQ